MKWFAPKEGIITEMKGIKKIEQLDSFHKIKVNKKVGDKAIFASHGGRAVFVLYLFNADRAQLLADIRRIEQMVEVKVSRVAVQKKIRWCVKVVKNGGPLRCPPFAMIVGYDSYS
jgi:hypothetical protein